MTVVAFVVAAAPLVPWLCARAPGDEARGGVLVSLFGLGLWWRAATIQTPTTAAPRQASQIGLWALFAAASAAAIAGALLPVRLLTATGVLLSVAAAHGLLRPARAAALTTAGLVCALGLPLAGDLDVVGFPLRLASAKLAAALLPVLGAGVQTSETVLVVEGAVADVEAPCAGLATLRHVLAAAFALASLWGQRVSRALVAASAAAAVAALGNATRVTALVALVLSAKAPGLAAVAHVPLGVLVCVAACVAAALVLDDGRRRSVPSLAPAARPRAVAAVAAAFAIVLSAARLAVVDAGPAPISPLPTMSASVPLSPPEARLFSRHAELAHKAHLPAPLLGERLLVVSSSLRSAHAPERCLASVGYRVDVSSVMTVDAVPVRVLVLDGGRRRGVSVLLTPSGGVSGLAELAWRMAVTRQRRFVFVSAVVDVPAGAAAADVVERVARQLISEARASFYISVPSPEEPP